LKPYPFADALLAFEFPARHVEGKIFSSAAEIQEKFAKAPVTQMTVTVCA
jgi:hypothetical protein